MNPHKCRESRTCECDPMALEPSEKCPIHTGPQWPPRCGICGRFMKRLSPKTLQTDIYHRSMLGIEITHAYFKYEQLSRYYAVYVDGELLSECESTPDFDIKVIVNTGLRRMFIGTLLCDTTGIPVDELIELKTITEKNTTMFHRFGEVKLFTNIFE